MRLDKRDTRQWQRTSNRITQDISHGVHELRSTHPDPLKGFYALSAAAMGEGALGKKTKELIALALGVAAHCDGCIGFHTRTLVRLGATREGVIEAIGVTVCGVTMYMGGGPSLKYAAEAVRALDGFAS